MYNTSVIFVWHQRGRMLMLLAIDIGNTTVNLGGVAGNYSDYQVVFREKLDTVRDWTAREYASGILHCLNRMNLTPEQFRGVVISSVVPPVLEPVGESARRIFGKEPMVISTKCDLGLSVALPHPELVGRDRLVDAAWAAHTYTLPAVTVDLGTATTFNVIGRQREFLGGVIAAGLETSLRALASRTAQLPAVALKTPERVIGKNTSECMLSGAVIGTAGLVDGVVAQIEQELGTSVTLVLTGGGAEYIIPYVRHCHCYDPDLILKGLAYLYDRNHPEAAVGK